MTTVAPPPPPPPAPPSGTPPPPPAALALAEVLLEQMPERLVDLPRTILVTATVASQTPDGTARVRTALGELILRSATALPTDKPILLQILAGQPPGRAIAFALGAGALPVPILASGAQPPVTLGGLAGGGVLGAAMPSLSPETLAALPRPGTVLPALVLGSGAAALSPGAAFGSGAPVTGGALPGGIGVPTETAAPGSLPGSLSAPALPAGSTPFPDRGIGGLPLAGTDSSFAPRLGGVGPGTDPEAPLAAPRSLAGAATPAQPSLSSPGSSGLGVGATVALRLLAVVPPGVAAAAEAMATTGAAAPSGAPTLSGTIAGTTPAGQPILATARGTFALATEAPLPPGTRITAELVDPASVPLRAGAATPSLATPWPTLQKALAALEGSDRTIAQLVLNTVMPQPNRRLGAALMFFLSAARRGDARAWLGEEANQALERTGRRDLLALLGDEFRTMARQAAEPLPEGWRPFEVPVYDGHALTRLHLHVRPVGDEDGTEGGGRERGARGSRFLIDVDLSRLGPLQLDGLVRPRRFDLILRSREGLAAETRQELTGVFVNCLETVGYTGGLTFQAGSRGWVSVAPRAHPVGVKA